MEEDEGGPRLSKRFSDNGGGEVDYKTTSGTAWSHSFLNQKPWHPLSYPNQRRKWIAEQTHAQRQRRTEEVVREYAQEQEFLRQTSLLSQKEKEKVDLMQAVSFMYVRPPGYNAESAKAAEIVDERKKLGESDPTGASSSSVPLEAAAVTDEKKKPRPKDVFGRALPTEEEFAVLKNAPRLETGVAGRVKPFAVEVRNVKCLRCGNYGHQSGDRECPMKDAIMPNDQSRLKRDDPLTAIVAHMDSSEPLKWELKQKPGISPPRGGFLPDDPNQQIVAEEIFDEYGGFLSGGNIPELLISSSKHKKKKSKSKSKHKKNISTSDSDDDQRNPKTKSKNKSKDKKRASCGRSHEDNDSTYDSDDDKSKIKNSKSKHKKRSLNTHSEEENVYTSDDDEHRRRPGREEQMHKSKKKKDLSHGKSIHENSNRDEYLDSYKHRDRNSLRHRESRDHDGSSDVQRNLSGKEKSHGSHKTTRNDYEFSSSDNSEFERHGDRRKHKRSFSSENLESEGHRGRRHHRQPHHQHHHRYRDS